MKQKLTRRHALRNTTLGMMALPWIPNSDRVSGHLVETPGNYPSLELEVVSEVVGKSHFDLDRVIELVEERPELARATWDWGFGDFESALGAASHVGRRDIAIYLMEKGARPNIFTFAVLGASDIVQTMVEFTPGIQRTLGPHGISLLRHAKAGLRMQESMTSQQILNCQKLITYLESLGDADAPAYEEVPEDEKPNYLGDYKYGAAAHQGFSIKLNMRKMLSLGKIGAFGGALYKIGDNQFFYNGAPSTKVTFQFLESKVTSLTIHEPGRETIAQKVSQGD